MPPTQHYLSPSMSEYPDGIKLTDFAPSKRTSEFAMQRSLPPGYHSKVSDEATAAAAAAAAAAPLLRPPPQQQSRPQANRQETEHILAHLSTERVPQLPPLSIQQQEQKKKKDDSITPAKILRQHVLARRKERDTDREDYEGDGDALVDGIVAVLKTITIAGVLVMVIWTAYKWYSLGPNYAPAGSKVGVSNVGNGGLESGR